MFLVIFVLIICVEICDGEKSQCTKQNTYNEITNKYSTQSIYCDFGCCGYYPDQYCCSISVEVAVGGFAGGLGGVCLIGIIVYTCVKKCCKSGRVGPESSDEIGARAAGWQIPYRPRTPHHTQINVVYADSYGNPQLVPGMAWSQHPGLRRARVIKPPAYRARNHVPPPPYPSSSASTSMASLHPSQATLPGAMPGNEDSDYSTGSRRTSMLCHADRNFRRSSVIEDIHSELDELATGGDDHAAMNSSTTYNVGLSSSSNSSNSNKNNSLPCQNNFTTTNSNNSLHAHFNDLEASTNNVNQRNANTRRGSNESESGGSSDGFNGGVARGGGSSDGLNGGGVARGGGDHRLLPLRGTRITINHSRGPSNSTQSPRHPKDLNSEPDLVNPFPPVEVSRSVSINPFIPEFV